MILKKLFGKKKPHPVFAGDDELVAAIRAAMGDGVADQVRGRMDDREEYDRDVARLEEELASLTWRREVELTGMNRQYDRLREKYIDVLQSRRKLLLRLRDANLLTDEEKDILVRSADEGEELE